MRNTVYTIRLFIALILTIMIVVPLKWVLGKLSYLVKNLNPTFRK